jgi:hypothetical protein
MIKRILEWIKGLFQRETRQIEKKEIPVKRIRIVYSPEYQAKLDKRRKRKRVEIQSRRYNYRHLKRRG